MVEIALSYRLRQDRQAYRLRQNDKVVKAVKSVKAVKGVKLVQRHEGKIRKAAFLNPLDPADRVCTGWVRALDDAARLLFSRTNTLVYQSWEWNMHAPQPLHLPPLVHQHGRAH